MNCNWNFQVPPHFRCYSRHLLYHHRHHQCPQKQIQSYLERKIAFPERMNAYLDPASFSSVCCCRSIFDSHIHCCCRSILDSHFHCYCHYYYHSFGSRRMTVRIFSSSFSNDGGSFLGNRRQGHLGSDFESLMFCR